MMNNEFPESGENVGSEPEAPAHPHWIERLRALLEVLMVAALGDLVLIPLLLVGLGLEPQSIFDSASVLGLLLMAKATFVLLLIYVLLIARGKSFSDLGWRRRPMGAETLRGLAFVPLLFAAMAGVALIFGAFFPDYVSEVNPLLEMLQRPSDLLIFLFSGIYVGGVQEEVQRAFVLRHFERFLGGALPGLLIWSVFFGWGHSMQGPDNAVKAGLLGLLFGLLYLRRRDLTSPIVSHAAFDVATILFFWFLMR